MILILSGSEDPHCQYIVENIGNEDLPNQRGLKSKQEIESLSFMIMVNIPVIRK